MRSIRRFLSDRSGATAIEYAMIGILISLAIIGGGTLIGRSVANNFNAVNNGFSATAS